MEKKKYFLIALLITGIHFVISFTLFGFLFTLGDSGNIPKSPLFALLTTLHCILLFPLFIVGAIDKIYYSRFGQAIPDFIYPVSIGISSLLWGFLIAYFLKWRAANRNKISSPSQSKGAI